MEFGEWCGTEAHKSQFRINEGFYCTCSYGHWNSKISTCTPCACNLRGSKAKVCNKSSGKCLCNQGVTGEKCDMCRPGLASFPSCSSCKEGYYGFPNCKKCQCSPDGTVSCNAHSGNCFCKSGVAGESCDKCAPDHKPFPECHPYAREPGKLFARKAW